MQIADAIVEVPRAALVTRATRRKFTPDFKHQVAAQCLLPGASLSAVALSHRINANVVRKWVRRAQQLNATSAGTMLAVSVHETPMLQPSSAQAPSSQPVNSPCMEIVTAGATVRLPAGFDAAGLRTILQILAEPR